MDYTEIMQSNKNSIIGVECALGLQGYSTFMSNEFPICLFEGEGHLHGVPSFVGVSSMPTKDELIIVNDILMTNPYRSIIDLIKTNPYSEDAVLGVMTMLNYDDEIRTMREYAKRYGVEKELMELIVEAENWEF